MTARATGNDQPHDLRHDRRDDQSGTATRNEISGGQSDVDAVYHRDKNSPLIYTRDGGGNGTVSGQVARVVSVFSLPSCSSYPCTHHGLSLRRAWRQAWRCLPVPLSARTVRVARRRPVFPVPSPRPVFRCPDCPTRRPSRPCPAWLRRCPGACGSRLRGRNHGRRAGRRYRPR